MNMTEDELQQVNVITGVLVRLMGQKLFKMKNFEQRMVCLEGLVAGLLTAEAVQGNKNPDQLADVFADRLKTRVTMIIYGPKQ